MSQVSAAVSARRRTAFRPVAAARRVPPAIWIFIAALVLRLGVVLVSRGGAFGAFAYDPSVYYASADALIHGRMPYADFVLLHPPALTLALVPFAALGRLTTDHTGFVAANTAFAVLGALCAAMLVRVGRQGGLPVRAAMLGGAFYAVWYGSIGAEISTRLEPLGNAAFLLGLVLLTRTGGVPGRRDLLFAGAAFGVAASVKIWWVVPVALVIGWQVLRRPGRRAGALVACGAVAAVTVVCGPFLLASPGPMWRMVIADQLGRHASTGPRLARILDMVSLSKAAAHGPQLVAAAVVVVIVAAVVLIGAAAWRVRPCRLFVAIAGAQFVVLLAAPIYFSYYSDFLAPAASLVIAAAAAGAAGPLARAAQAAAVTSVAVTAAATGGAILGPARIIVSPFPGGALARGVRGGHCVMADSPMALIAMDALSRDLANGCRNWVDVSGRTYDVDAPVGRFRSRPHNRRWQVDVERYLLSGDAVILIRPTTGLSGPTRRAVTSLRPLVTSHGITVYRVRASVGPGRVRAAH